MAINTLYGQFMDVIEIKTLIDITNTRVVRPNQGTSLAYDQNRNFITLIQCVELRSIITYNNPPTVDIVNLDGSEFGTEYIGEHHVWTFTFMPDRVGIYNIDKHGHSKTLIDDIDGVPIIKNLSETINIERAIFDCMSVAYKNTLIKAHLGTI
jgi:hypothetical protein